MGVCALAVGALLGKGANLSRKIVEHPAARALRKGLLACVRSGQYEVREGFARGRVEVQEHEEGEEGHNEVALVLQVLSMGRELFLVVVGFALIA